MKRTNVTDTGHLVEQSTKMKNFRPELGVFHGYSYIRRSNTVIEVWIPSKCDGCQCAIHLEGHFVRVASATDADIQRHGLKLYPGEAPVFGSRIHTGSPYFCNPCRDKWLKGESLPELSATIVRDSRWN